MTSSAEINSLIFMGCVVLGGWTACVCIKGGKVGTVISRMLVSAAIVFTILLSLPGGKASDLQWYIPLYFMFLVWPVLVVASVFDKIKQKIGFNKYIIVLILMTFSLLYWFYIILKSP